MNVQRVERISDFMRHACCQQGQRIQTFRFDSLLGCAPALSDIPQDNDVANLLSTSSDRPAWRAEALRSPLTRSLLDASPCRSYIYRLAVFNHQRKDIKIDEAILRIENFQVMTDRPGAFRK